jgi:hypothetical protein
MIVAEFTYYLGGIMDYEDRYWNDSEEANAEHVQDLIIEIRNSLALDQHELPDDWADSEESWLLAKRVDRLAAAAEQFVESDFTVPPAGFGPELESIRGLRIRQVLREHPLAEFRRQFFGACEPSVPYVAIDTDAEAVLRTLLRHRLGYKRRHWNVTRVIDAAGASIVVTSKRGETYLGRMWHCYVLELDNEVVTWARAVLEAELEQALEEDAADASVVRLGERLNKAGCLGILSGREFEAANLVRTAGNDTLHVMPGLWLTAAVVRDLRIATAALGSA